MKLLTAAILMTASMSAQAEFKCDAIGDLAGLSVMARYAGVPISDTIRSANAAEQPAPVQRVMRSIVVGAYDLPRYYTDASIQRQMQDYQSRWHIECLRYVGDV